jgi:hypothetical protein
LITLDPSPTDLNIKGSESNFGSTPRISNTALGVVLSFPLPSNDVYITDNEDKFPFVVVVEGGE